MANDSKNEATAAVKPLTTPPVSRRHGHGHPPGEGRRAQFANDCPLVKRFFCNGDPFYPGHRIYVSLKRYHNLDRFLGELSKILDEAVNLPYGVRQIFRAEDGRRVESLDDIVCDERGDFVCAGFETFRPLPYGQKYGERWCVGKPAMNCLSPRDLAFQKNAKSCGSLDATETEDASADARPVVKNLDTLTVSPRRLNQKPANPPHRSESVNGVGPGETVTPGTEPKGEEVRVRSAAFKVMTSFKVTNSNDDYHRTRRKLNCSEASLPNTRTQWPCRLRRTPEYSERSRKTLAPCRSCGSFRKPENIRKSPEITPTCRNRADTRHSSREIARSQKVPEMKRITPENFERPTDARSPLPAADVPGDSVKTGEIAASSRAASASSRTSRVSSREIPRSSLEVPVSSRENRFNSHEVPTTAAKTSETPESCKHSCALHSHGKPAVSAKNTTEFSPSHFPLDLNSAFPQTSRQSELQAVLRLPLNSKNGQNPIRRTKSIQNSITKPPDQSQTNAHNLEIADPEHISYRRKGSKSRNRETPLKSMRSVDRLIVEPGFVAKRFHMGEVLGEGNFAVVRRCQAKGTETEYAMKVISKSKMRDKEEVVENELKILRRCHHPNIVRLIESYETKTEVYVVMELVEGGDLFEAIRCHQKFPEGEASSMVKDLAKALQYLHQRNIVHRDVKPENLLVQRKIDGSVKRLKLADFGLAVVTTEPLYKLCGTPTYVAPEILSDIGYGSEVDMWSVGVILYILLSGYPPFRSSRRNDSELFELIQVGRFVFDAPRWDHISDEAQDLIRRLLERRTRKRLRAEEVLRHPWIRSGATEHSPISTERPRPSTQSALLPVAIDGHPQTLVNTIRTANLIMGGHHPHR